MGGGREGSSSGAGGSGPEVDVFVSSSATSSKERGLPGRPSNGFDGCSVVSFGPFRDTTRCSFVVEDRSADTAATHIRLAMFLSRKTHSQQLTTLSLPPLARNCPSLLHARPHTSALCPTSSITLCFATLTSWW